MCVYVCIYTYIHIYEKMRVRRKTRIVHFISSFYVYKKRVHERYHIQHNLSTWMKYVRYCVNTEMCKRWLLRVFFHFCHALLEWVGDKYTKHVLANASHHKYWNIQTPSLESFTFTFATLFLSELVKNTKTSTGECILRSMAIKCLPLARVFAGLSC